jgi:hypothetical protein
MIASARPDLRSRLVICLAACLLLTGTGLADVLPDPRPIPVGDLELGPKRSAPLELRVAIDDASRVDRIVIPAAVLAKLAGGGPSAGGIAAPGAARSVVAGLAISVAVAFGFVAYRRGRLPRAATALLWVVAATGTWAFVAPAWADMPPNGWFRRPDRGRNFVDVATLRSGSGVTVEISAPGEDAVVYVVGRKGQRAE